MDHSSPPQQTTSERILGSTGAIAPVLMLMAVAVAGYLHPSYSHLHQPISALGAEGAAYRAILNYLGLIPAGILTFLFAFAIRRAIKGSWLTVLSTWLIGLAGLGRFVAGIFPCDPGCLEFVSLSSKIHAVAGLTALFSGAAAPVVMALGLRARATRAWSVISAICGLCALGAMIAASLQLWPDYLGLFQRLVVGFTYAWTFVLGIEIGIKRISSLPPLRVTNQL